MEKEITGKGQTWLKSWEAVLHFDLPHLHHAVCIGSGKINTQEWFMIYAKLMWFYQVKEMFVKF